MEIWDLYNEHREKTGEKHVRGEEIPENRYHLVVHVWIQNAEGKFLISKRSANRPTFPLMWECVGGSVLENETSLEGAIREVREEVGIKLLPTQGNLLFSQVRKVIDGKKFNDILDVWLFSYDGEASLQEATTDEVADAKWMTVSEIQEFYDVGKLVDTLKYFFNESMQKRLQRFAYHVVTDHPMQVGQHIIFDKEHHNGVYKRVCDKLEIVEDIYSNPDKYKADRLEHHTSVALRELALEEVRQAKFPDYPSRMSCLYVSETLEEARRWCESFIMWGRPTYHIVKLKIQGNIFRGDANNCFDGHLDKETNLYLAERYWLNLPNEKDERPIMEILVDGDIEVVEIVEEVNANLT